METNFNFKSQICTTREQSERLLALGLKKETADCVWIEMSKDDWRVDANDWKAYYSIIEEGIVPAWSLHRLIEIVAHTQYPYYVISKELPIYDALCERIEWLIKKGYFPKEYFMITQQDWQGKNSLYVAWEEDGKLHSLVSQRTDGLILL